MAWVKFLVEQPDFYWVAREGRYSRQNVPLKDIAESST
jgi:hypothetical protein